MNKAINIDELSGAYTALMTPMKDQGKMDKPIDYDTLEKMIDEQISAGVDGILACGTTGQSATLSHDEHIELAEWIYDQIDGRTDFIAGVGSNNTQESIYLADEIERRIGPTTFLAVTGYYNNPPQEGLYEHFSTLADNIGDESNLILYNVPGRTSSNISAETTKELARHPKIIGIKEASGNLEQVEDIISNTDDSYFRVLSGEDHLVASIGEMGGHGVISASMNVAPKYFAEMAKMSNTGDHETSKEMQEYIMPLVKSVFSAKNPIPLAHMYDTHLRLPLVRMEGLQKNIDEVLSRYTSEELGVDISRYR